MRIELDTASIICRTINNRTRELSMERIDIPDLDDLTGQKRI